MTIARPTFAGLLIDCEKDRTLRRAVLVGDVARGRPLGSEPLVETV
jgi:hypothetical protein